MPDYIPAPDAEFDVWQQNFVAYASANLAALGLVAADMTPITAGQAVWTSAYPAHVSAQAAAESATAAKDGSRVSYVFQLRLLVKQLQASPADEARGQAARLQQAPVPPAAWATSESA